MIKGKIVLVPFPFDDLSLKKVRPAICLTNNISKYNHIIIAFITSSMPANILETDICIDSNHSEFYKTGLKISSTIRLHRLITISSSLVKRELGQIPYNYQTQIDEKLIKLFGSKTIDIPIIQNLQTDFFSKHDPKILPIIRKATIGIAGAGGLGSNVAVTLARVGIGKLIIADFDKIETSNLNRQQYFFDQIGKPKVIALLENLKKINPFSEYKIYHIKLDKKNIPIIFKDVDIMVEAFDKAEMKKMLIETWLSEFPEKPIIAGSGLAGYGKNEIIHTHKFHNLYLCGDEESNLQKGISPMAPRVGIVAKCRQIWFWSCY